MEIPLHSSIASLCGSFSTVFMVLGGGHAYFVLECDLVYILHCALLCKVTLSKYVH